MRLVYRQLWSCNCHLTSRLFHEEKEDKKKEEITVLEMSPGECVVMLHVSPIALF